MFLGLCLVALVYDSFDALEGEIDLSRDLIEILVLLLGEGQLPVHFLAEIGEF